VYCTVQYEKTPLKCDARISRDTSNSKNAINSKNASNIRNANNTRDVIIARRPARVRTLETKTIWNYKYYLLFPT
jgi:hypothetical protein